MVCDEYNCKMMAVYTFECDCRQGRQSICMFHFEITNVNTPNHFRNLMPIQVTSDLDLIRFIRRQNESP